MKTTPNEQQLRELDAWIAEHVMGWAARQLNLDGAFWSESEKRMRMILGSALHVRRQAMGMDDPSTGPFVFAPTTDPAAAMAVMEKCAEKCVVTVEHGSKGWMIARLSDHDGSYVEDFCKVEPTLPLAICRFAVQLFKEQGK